VIFLNWLKRNGKFQVTRQAPFRANGSILNLVTGLLVVFIIAAQEEVLYRGYIFLNLNVFGPYVYLVGSTLIFVLIHFLTNRVSLHQIISWTLSGLVLATAFLISGSIWVPVLLRLPGDVCARHAGNDVFNIWPENPTRLNDQPRIEKSLAEKFIEDKGNPFCSIDRSAHLGLHCLVQLDVVHHFQDEVDRS
jgi:hypothetical protein